MPLMQSLNPYTFSNTTKRVLSALIMLALVVTSVTLGSKWTLGLCFAVGLLGVDEVLTHFSKIGRLTLRYLSSMILFCVLFGLINYVPKFHMTRMYVLYLGIILQLVLVYYLVHFPIDLKTFKNKNSEYPTLISYLIMIPLMSFGLYFEVAHWKEFITLLLIVTAGMDTGAWFFGKNFGKRQLCPSVSPKKTIEGLIGGMFTSSILATGFCWVAFQKYESLYFLVFALLGLISQVGDLIQSKIKREFELKDSSHLIPGHGGVYDRIDSVIFLSPFFILVVKYLQILPTEF
jgi:phosphatidate cytidylyltransferase